MAIDDDEMFYVLDARTVVGNCAMFWASDGRGYVCDLAKAGLYRREDLPRCRDTDIAVPAGVAKRLAVTHVRIEALRGEGLLDDLDRARAEHARLRDLEERALDDIAQSILTVIVERLAEHMTARMVKEEGGDTSDEEHLDDLWPDAVRVVCAKLASQITTSANDAPEELAALRAEYHPRRLAAFVRCLVGYGVGTVRHVVPGDDVCQTCFDAGFFCLDCY